MNKKTLLILLATGICLVSFIVIFIIRSVQSTDNKIVLGNKEGLINAVVIEINDNSVIAECYESIKGEITEGQKIRIERASVVSEPLPEIGANDKICIFYDGSVSEENGILQPKRIISVELIKGSTDR